MNGKGKLAICAAAALVCVSLTAPGQAGGKASGSGYVDVHCHLFGSIKKSGGGPAAKQPRGRKEPAGGKQRPGKPGPGPRGSADNQRGAGSQGTRDFSGAGDKLVDLMDDNGVGSCLVMPPPRTEDNKDDSEVPEIMSLAKKYPGRIVPVAGGNELNPIIHKFSNGNVPDKMKKKFRDDAEKLAASGIGAFGEMAALHLSFQEAHVFEQVSPDHPLFLELADVAARHSLAIDLHMEAVPREMPVPSGFSKNNSGMMQENISGLERLLEHNRKAHIVWQHIGWDNTGEMKIELLRRLLASHPNLFLAIRIENRPFMMDKKTPMPNRIVDEDYNIRPEWLAFFNEFPDRFVVGTDEFVGNTGSFMGQGGGAPQSFEETWRALKQLPKDLAQKIGRENALRIYNLD